MTRRKPLRRFSLIIVAAMSSAIAVTARADGPLGVERGADPSKIPTCTPIGNLVGRFRCSTLPRSHPDLTSYFLGAMPGIGVCWIRAVSDEIPTSRSGDQLRAAVDTFARQIELKYGSDRRREDVVRKGSIWASSGDWMMAVVQKDRAYTLTWAPETGANLPDRLRRIYLAAAASGPTSGTIVIDFLFDNAGECTDAETKEKAARL